MNQEPDHSSLTVPESWAEREYPAFNTEGVGQEGERWMNNVTLPPIKNVPNRFDKSISVVITNFRYTLSVPYAIISMLKQDFPHEMLEIIVVDDNSSFDNLLYLKSMITVLQFAYADVNFSLYETWQNVTYNICLAFNIGLKRATNDVVVNNPADGYQRGDYLKTVSRYHTLFAECGTHTAVCPNILRKDPKTGNFSFDYRPTTDVGLAATKDDYAKIGGYNESHRGWGSNEPDLTGRLGLSGCGIGFCPTIAMATCLDAHLLQKLFGKHASADFCDSRNTRETTWGNSAINHIHSAECQKKGIFNPNGEVWGELDTLKQVI